MTDLTLYGTICMAALCGLLLILGAGIAIDELVQRKLADQEPWSSAPNSRGASILIDTQAPGRHRALNRALTQRYSLAAAGLAEATARLAVDRVRRVQQQREFVELMAGFCRRRPVVVGRQYADVVMPH